MSPRRWAALLGAIAAITWIGLALPARREAAELREEARRIWRIRRESRERLQALESREAARRRAAALQGPGVDVTAVRRSVLASLEGARVRGVRLEVRPASPPAGSTLRLFAEGSTREVLRLCTHLVRPGSGLVLESVRLDHAAAGLTMDIEALGLGEASP